MSNIIAELVALEHIAENTGGMRALVHGHDGVEWIALLVNSAGEIEIA